MYIVFEGIVWSGKTTQAKKLGAYFSSKYLDHDVIMIREPGSTPIAEDIRHLAQGKIWENESMHPLTNAYLYSAARAQTLHTIINPALARGDIIISDRSFLSSCAYQGEAQWLGIEIILDINKAIIQGVTPDIVLYMDISIDSAILRTFDHQWDKWENMWKPFFEKIIYGYEKCEKLDIMKNRFIRIDANGTEEEVFENILNALKNSFL